ncbi:MAG: acetyl-CoA hydrolase/transferase family protein [Planctomycetes bacterium]|nr:acetyl-CoA hydrolase/transferase family protein [Planctomycetota bacterium]
MTHWIKAEDVGEILHAGMTVFVAGATAEPREILQTLAAQGSCCAGVRFVSVTVPGVNGVDFSALHPQASSTAFLATAENRKSIAANRVDFIPLHYSDIYSYLERELRIDVVLLQLPPAGNDGAVCLGVSADFTPAVLDKAGLVIGEINQHQPAPADSPRIPLARLDYALACDRPVPTLASASISDAGRRIGGHVSELIKDGDCIQIGIGAISDAIMNGLSGKNDLGIHSGMISDGIMTLAQAGNITGSRKSLDTGRIVSGATLGSQRLLEWAGAAPQLSIRPVGYTHDSGVIRRIDNFVSINSALEVDLFGQVNADMLGGRQFSGTGGAVDMMRGAALSRGGRSIIALGATADGGKISRIVAALAPHTATTALRTDIDYVVTEYGARRIRHLPAMARARALIEIAHPDFRAQLHQQWSELARS